MSSNPVAGFSKDVKNVLLNIFKTTDPLYLSLWKPDSEISDSNQYLYNAGSMSSEELSNYNFYNGEVVYTNTSTYPTDSRIAIQDYLEHDSINQELYNSSVIELDPMGVEHANVNIGGFLISSSSIFGEGDISFWSYFTEPRYIGLGDQIKFNERSIILKFDDYYRL